MNELAVTHSGCRGASAAVSSPPEGEREGERGREGERERGREREREREGERAYVQAKVVFLLLNIDVLAPHGPCGQNKGGP